MRHPIAILILGSLALGLLIAGCGGGDSSAEAEQIDKATFVKRGNRICQQASGKLAAEVTAIANRESAKPGASRTQIQISLVKTALVPSLEAELAEIRALGIPGEAKKQVQAFFKASQGVIDKAKANPKAFNEGFSPYEAAEVAGTRFGLSECPIAPVSTG